MAVYCISDVHGKIESLQEMLKGIGFRKDGTDSLFILGDIIDWSDKSIDTLRYCMKLEREYDFVHVLMGNHEEMFKEAINKYTISGIEYLIEKGHFEINKQEETMRGYIDLGEEEREAIKEWIGGLKYAYRVNIGEKKYYLTHSYVYRNTRDAESMSYKNHYERMVWERVQKDENPMKTVRNEEDTILIHGHTIVSNYNSYNEKGKLKIYKDIENQTIGIDCGAKVLGQKERARLACIRLEDLKEYYIEYEDNQYKIEEE